MIVERHLGHIGIFPRLNERVLRKPRMDGAWEFVPIYLLFKKNAIYLRNRNTMDFREQHDTKDIDKYDDNHN